MEEISAGPNHYLEHTGLLFWQYTWLPLASKYLNNFHWCQCIASENEKAYLVNSKCQPHWCVMGATSTSMLSYIYIKRMGHISQMADFQKRLFSGEIAFHFNLRNLQPFSLSHTPDMCSSMMLLLSMILRYFLFIRWFHSQLLITSRLISPHSYNL